MNKEKTITNIANVSDEVQYRYPPLSHFEKSHVKDISTENNTNKNLTSGNINDNDLKESDSKCSPELSITNE